MADQQLTNVTVVAKASERYSEQTAVRAAVQAIPYIGGPLDTLLAGKGTKIHRQRVEHLITELDQRLRRVEKPQSPTSEEELLDLMVGAFDRAARTRSEQKRARFAQIISTQIEKGGAIDDAELALRLVSDLDDIHIQLLDVALHAPIIPDLFDGRRVVTIAQSPLTNSGGHTSLHLAKAFPIVAIATLRMVCAELVAKGLFRDEGIGRWDTPAMEYFVPTDLAGWLYKWLIAK